MTDNDSGVETANESNESISMSIGSPSHFDDEKVLLENYNPPTNFNSAFGNFPLTVEHFCFTDYNQHDIVRKVKRRKLRHKLDSLCAKVKVSVDKIHFLRAASANNIEAVRDFLNNGIDPCTSDNRQRTALHFAAAGGHTEVAKLLLERGANPNQRDSVGNTPLHLAACTTHIAMVTLLLKAGTDINALDNSGRSPFHLAHSKLKLLQMNKEFSSNHIKGELVNILEMMEVYLQRSGRSVHVDFISAFTNRLQQHSTREEVDTDVTDLLSGLSHLSLQAS